MCIRDRSHTRWSNGGQYLSELKYKGLNLNGETASKQLTASIYDTQVKDFLLGIQNKVTVTQTKRYTYLNTLKKNGLLLNYICLTQS